MKTFRISGDREILNALNLPNNNILQAENEDRAFEILGDLAFSAGYLRIGSVLNRLNLTLLNN